MDSIIINKSDNISTTIGEFSYNYRGHTFVKHPWHIGVLIFSDMIQYLFDLHNINSVSLSIEDTSSETIYRLNYKGGEFNILNMIENLSNAERSTLARIWIRLVNSHDLVASHCYKDGENEIKIIRFF